MSTLHRTAAGSDHVNSFGSVVGGPGSLLPDLGAPHGTPFGPVDTGERVTVTPGVRLGRGLPLGPLPSPRVAAAPSGRTPV